MKYKRVQSVSNMMIDYQSAKLLRYVQDKDEYNIVWKSVMDYFEKAREKDAQNVEFIMPNVSDIAKDAIIGMLASIDDGIEKYWNMVRKNQKSRNGDDGSTTGQPKVDNESTTSQPLVVLGRPNKSNVMETEVEMRNGNSQYNTESSLNRTKGYCRNKLLRSDRAEEYKRVLHMMQDYGLEVTDSSSESIAYKMDEFGIDENDVRDALIICEKQGKIKIDYFFAIINRTIDGWNNSANQ